jgi:hypothetical protein
MQTMMSMMAIGRLKHHMASKDKEKEYSRRRQLEELNEDYTKMIKSKKSFK